MAARPGGADPHHDLRHSDHCDGSSSHAEQLTGFWKYQKQADEVYQNLFVQLGVAGLIVANFVLNIAQMQFDPSKLRHTEVFRPLGDMFTIIFTIELALNMYSSWCWRFWSSGWNRFDFLVVSIGILDFLPVALPGVLGKVRLLRAFRVFRLFSRVKSLRDLTKALIQAVPGVCNSLVIMMIVVLIYALLAVEFFSNIGDGCKKGDIAYTARGGCVGQEYFGTFLRALYTLFQVLTGDSWSEAIARPIMYHWTPFGTGFFFMTFIFFNTVVLMNVVVTVLTDAILDVGKPDEEHGDPTDELVDPCEKLRDTVSALSIMVEEKRKEFQGSCASKRRLAAEVRQEAEALKQDAKVLAGALEELASMLPRRPAISAVASPAMPRTPTPLVNDSIISRLEL